METAEDVPPEPMEADASLDTVAAVLKTSDNLADSNDSRKETFSCEETANGKTTVDSEIAENPKENGDAEMNGVEVDEEIQGEEASDPKANGEKNAEPETEKNNAEQTASEKPKVPRLSTEDMPALVFNDDSDDEDVKDKGKSPAGNEKEIAKEAEGGEPAEQTPAKQSSIDSAPTEVPMDILSENEAPLAVDKTSEAETDTSAESSVVKATNSPTADSAAVDFIKATENTVKVEDKKTASTLSAVEPAEDNIIELSDDDDEDIGPTEPKRRSTGSQEENEPTKDGATEAKESPTDDEKSSSDPGDQTSSQKNCEATSAEEAKKLVETLICVESKADSKEQFNEDTVMKSPPNGISDASHDETVAKSTPNEKREALEETKPTASDTKPSIEEEKFPIPSPVEESKAQPVEDVKIDDMKPMPMEIDEPAVKDEPKPSLLSVADDAKDFFYDKECVNYDCHRKMSRFVKAPIFVLNFYKISRKSSKLQFVCETCFDSAVDKYADLAASLEAHEPLLEQDIPKRQEFVEILDSSDEEEDEKITKMRIDADEPKFEDDTIEMLQKELDNTICEILGRVEIKKQVDWCKTILKDKLNKMEVDCEEITASLQKLQKDADRMHTNLYQCPKIKIKELQALDLNTGRPFSVEPEFSLPPLGELKYPSIELNGNYFAVRNKVIASWLPCRVVEFVDLMIDNKNPVQYFKVKYMKLKVPTVKCISAKHMAYGDPPNVRLSIGTRVIALFDGSTLSRNNREIIAPSAFYPGIIAEQLQAYNKYRYLIFFDDGYAQYVHHKDIRIVCQQAENVWEDVHPGSREFIRNYLSQYQKHRPMVQVKKGQSMITESNGKWLYAKVVDVDGSLVQMQFDGQTNRYEWIYRGSTRLGPLYKEKQSNGIPTTVPSALGRRTEPYIRYDEDASRNDTAQTTAAARAVAKKSTAQKESQQAAAAGATVAEAAAAPTVKHLNNSTIFLEDDNRPKGKVVYYTAKKNLPPKTFIPHQCHPGCLFTITHNLNSYSPLAKPLLSGWERQIFKSKLKKSVVYRAPCGRRLRNMEELHKYLRMTKNSLNVDNFDYDSAIHCLAEYVIESSIVSKPDMSNGLENMVIPCVNYYDNTMPPPCEYSSERIPTEGVNLNLDPAFLGGCDCQDDCLDKSKCSCWQLTMEGARFGNQNIPPENVGYTYKRLLDPVQTGVYECNANCKCSKSCLNRVVQHPLQMKLQVFKTSNRGWGLRCLNDVPKGSFICIYAGHLLTEQKANEGGVNASDEYFAELDYIEVVERIKEGYESDIQEDNESEDEDIEEPNPDPDSDEDFRSKAAITKNPSVNTRLRSRRSTTDGKNGNSEDDSQERRVISYEPTTSLGTDEPELKKKFKSVRKFFGKNEYVYVMDAKTTGNIGRYFNHSCSPNLFVQNVFVDTQDPRFPWVAFFALTHIRAGTELTWNYNYEVGIVPGKVLYCECGAPNCRGRLL